MGFFVGLPWFRLGWHEGMGTEGALQSVMSPVLTVLLVPFNSGGKPSFPFGGGIPPELVELFRLNRIATIVVLAVFDKGNQLVLLVGLAANLEEVFCDS